MSMMMRSSGMHDSPITIDAPTATDPATAQFVVCRTKNSAYLFRGLVVVAVWALGSQALNPDHPTNGLELQGGLRFIEGFGEAPQAFVKIGDRLLFAVPAHDRDPKNIATSVVQEIKRPTREELTRYMPGWTPPCDTGA